MRVAAAVLIWTVLGASAAVAQPMGRLECGWRQILAADPTRTPQSGPPPDAVILQSMKTCGIAQTAESAQNFGLYVSLRQTQEADATLLKARYGLGQAALSALVAGLTPDDRAAFAAQATTQQPVSSDVSERLRHAAEPLGLPQGKDEALSTALRYVMATVVMTDLDR